MKIPAQVLGGGNLLEVRIEPDFHQNRKPVNHGKKLKIKGFSSKARYQLAKELSRIVWPVEPGHVCLTYGDTWPVDPKGDLAAIREYFRRQGCAGVWRLEFQSRGLAKAKGRMVFCNGERTRHPSAERARAHADALNAFAIVEYVPHYHLLLCPPPTEEQEQWWRAWWARRTGNPAQAGFRVTYRESGRASWYLALHTSKGDQAPDIEVGRWWGWIDGPAVKSWMLREDFGLLLPHQVHRLQRIARRLSRGRLKFRRGQSFSVFLSEYWQKRVLIYLSTLSPGGSGGVNQK